VDKLLSEPLPYRDENHYRDYRTAALQLAQKKVEQFNAIYNFRVNRVGIRNQQARWGSCSWNGNLNFNYKIMFLPEELQDYLVAHELCHLAELNHGENFWKLVAKTIPNVDQRHAELRAKGPRFY
jgi:predicted metal-dependent hydrolase